MDKIPIILFIFLDISKQQILLNLYNSLNEYYLADCQTCTAVYVPTTINQAAVYQINVNPTITGTSQIKVRFDTGVFPTQLTTPICAAVSGFTAITCGSSAVAPYWDIDISSITNSFSSQAVSTGISGAMGRCDITGTGTEQITMMSLSGTFSSVVVSGSVFASSYQSGTTTTTVSTNGLTSVLVLSITIVDQLPDNGNIVVMLPKQQQYYTAHGLTIAPSSMIDGCTSSSCSFALTTTCTTTVGGTTTALTIGWTTNSYGATLDRITIRTQYGGFMAAGTVVDCEVSTIINPPSTQAFNQIEVLTTDSAGNDINSQTNVALTTNTAGTFTSGTMAITTSAVVYASPSTYSFYMITANPIPDGSYITIALPTGSSAVLANIAITCIQGCIDTTGPVYSYSTATNIITIDNIFTYGVAAAAKWYVQAGLPLQFEVTGFVNPQSATAHYFTVSSYETTGGTANIVDTISSIFITPIQGVIDITWMAPQNTSKIYDIAENYTIQWASSLDFLTGNALVLTFPSDFEVQTNLSCVVSGMNTNSFNSAYTCTAYASTNVITIGSFTTATIPANTYLTFTISSIKNPGLISTPTQSITISQTPSTTDTSIMATGTYFIPAFTYNDSTIEAFTVTSSNYNTGQYPTNWTFDIIPRSKVNKGAWIQIDIPPELVVPDKSDSQYNCGGDDDIDISGFTEKKIYCGLSNDNSQLTIRNGFWYNASVDLPQIKFNMQFLKNPRSTQTTGNFNVTIYSSDNYALYYWNTSYGPNLTMTGVLGPEKIFYTKTSLVNGAIPNYTWTVVLNNSYLTGDSIVLIAPSPVRFTQYTECFGVEGLYRNVSCTISDDFETLNMTVDTQIYRQEWMGKRRLQSTVLQAGDIIRFNVTSVRNPTSFRPTANSFIYKSSVNGYNIEEQSTGLITKNSLPYVWPVGEQQRQIGIVPTSKSFGLATNYTFFFVPKNYEIGMTVLIKVPKKINISESLRCIGLTGTDKRILNCSANYTTRKINITDGFSSIQIAPDNVTIVIESLINPTNRTIVQSFQISTYTYDNYLMDSRRKKLRIRFICNDPCKTCSRQNYDYCYSCYNQSFYPFYFNTTCVDKCPKHYFGWVQNSSCNLCESPCSECVDSNTTCTACIPGYYLQGSSCLRSIEVFLKANELFYPWPFLSSAVFLVLVILLIMLCSKETRFRSSAIALVAWPEILSWITLAGLLFYLNEFSINFGLVIIGVLTHLCLNVIFGIVHQRTMVPNSSQDYQLFIAKSYKCSNTTLMFCFIFTFKFHQIIISYLNGASYLQGEYNAHNWRIWNIICLTYMFTSYLPVAVSTFHYVVTNVAPGDDLYSGSILFYLNIEVLIISTFVMILLLFRSFQYCCCRKYLVDRKRVGKEETYNQIDQSSVLDDDKISQENQRDSDIEKNNKLKKKVRISEEYLQHTEHDEEDEEVSTKKRKLIMEEIDMLTVLTSKLKNNVLLTEHEKQQILQIKERLLQEKLTKSNQSTFMQSNIMDGQDFLLSDRKKLDSQKEEFLREVERRDLSNIENQTQKQTSGRQSSKGEETSHESVQTMMRMNEVTFLVDIGFESNKQNEQINRKNQESRNTNRTVLSDIDEENESDREHQKGGELASQIGNQIDFTKDFVNSAPLFERVAEDNNQTITELSQSEISYKKVGPLNAVQSQFKKTIFHPEQSTSSFYSLGSPSKPKDLPYQDLKSNEVFIQLPVINEDTVIREEELNRDQVGGGQGLHEQFEAYFENIKAEFGESQQIYEKELAEDDQLASISFMRPQPLFIKQNQSKDDSDSNQLIEQEAYFQNVKSIFGTVPYEKQQNEEMKENVEIKADDFYQSGSEKKVGAVGGDQVQDVAQDLPSKKKKKVLYSDKSESSVDEMMEDTPSNYNIPNGRLDGKSLGLKGMILYNKKKPGDPNQLPMDAIEEDKQDRYYDVNVTQEQQQNTRFVSNLDESQNSRIQNYPPRDQQEEERKFINYLFKDSSNPQTKITEEHKKYIGQNVLQVPRSKRNPGFPADTERGSWKAFNSGMGNATQIMQSNNSGSIDHDFGQNNYNENYNDDMEINSVNQKIKKKKKKVATQKQFKEPSDRIRNLEDAYLGHNNNDFTSDRKPNKQNKQLLPRIGGGFAQDDSKASQNQLKDQKLMKNNFI